MLEDVKVPLDAKIGLMWTKMCRKMSLVVQTADFEGVFGSFIIQTIEGHGSL